MRHRVDLDDPAVGLQLVLLDEGRVARVGEESRRNAVIHASSPRSASNIGRTLLRSQHASGSRLEQARSHRPRPAARPCTSPTRSTTFSPSVSVSCSLNARVSANWNPVSRNRIGMSGRIWVAMCITTVPSAWNADAIAMRSRPRSLERPRQDLASAAPPRTGVRARLARRRGGGSAQGAVLVGCARGVPGGCGVYSAATRFRMLRSPYPYRKAGNPPCPTSTRSPRTAEPSSTSS